MTITDGVEEDGAFSSGVYAGSGGHMLHISLVIARFSSLNITAEVKVLF